MGKLRRICSIGFVATTLAILGPAVGADEGAATVAFTKAPAEITSLRRATFEFTADPVSAETTCSLDGAAPEACVSPLLLTGLSDREHVLEIRALDGSGQAGLPATWSWTVDKEAPEDIVLEGPFDRRFRLEKTIPLGWSATDPGGDPIEYRLTVERIRPSGVLDGYEIVSDWSHDTDTRFSAAPGFTYCFAVTARDLAGNRSVSPSRCLSRPLDDTRLIDPAKEWRRVEAGGAYLDTETRSPRPEVTLKRHRVGATSIALVATTCPKCGAVDVFLDDDLLARVDLASKTMRRKRIIPVSRFDAPRSGNLMIRSVSVWKPVIVEGVGLANDPRSRILLEHSSVGLRNAARGDVEQGLVDPRLIDALLQVSGRHELLRVGPFITKHSTFVEGTERLSLHKFGRAVDIYLAGGRQVERDNLQAKSLARAFLELPPPIRPERMGCPWSLASDDVIVFTNNHEDHIHVSFAEPPLSEVSD